MDHDAEFVPLEINPVIADPKPMQRFARALQLAETLQVGAHNLMWQAAKLPQNAQLKFLGHARQFGSAGGIEDDLERSHEFSAGPVALPALVARTGIEPVFQP